MLGVSLIIIAAAIVYMVETYISTYYTIEYMHGTSLFLVLLAEYGTPVLFLLLCAYIAYRNFLKKQKAAASAASERPTSKEELYTNKIQTALTPPTIEIVGFPGLHFLKSNRSLLYPNQQMTQICLGRIGTKWQEGKQTTWKIRCRSWT